MNIYFCGIGGVGLGPLAEIALDAGHTVYGSDKHESAMTRKLAERGVQISDIQDGKFLRETHTKHTLDWFVYTSGIPDNHPEMVTARGLGMRVSKRDDFLQSIIDEHDLHLVAISGTHGKTTTTAMMVWALQQFNVPIGYSIGTTIPFGPSGKFDPSSNYFIYECDEFDRNFLKFYPLLSVITSIDFDHPDTYGTSVNYLAAFRQFLGQSEHSILWQNDANLLGEGLPEDTWLLSEHDIAPGVTLAGVHNRLNASLVVKALERLGIATENAVEAINRFPGADRRFEKLGENLYTDYGHHPTEIAATLEMARELSSDVVLVYQPHQNLRQHEFRSQYADCFNLAHEIYWLPTYLTREDPTLPVLRPEDLVEDITNRDAVYITDLNDGLWNSIQDARARGALVLCMGAGTIDEWVRGKLGNRD